MLRYEVFPVGNRGERIVCYSLRECRRYLDGDHCISVCYYHDLSNVGLYVATIYFPHCMHDGVNEMRRERMGDEYRPLLASCAESYRLALRYNRMGVDLQHS